jgi:uncharacterized protein (TIGR02147 family)
MQKELGYLEIIKDEYASRVDVNSHYSMRAFARDLEISPSRLSEVLNERGGLSSEMAYKIAVKLGLEKEEINYFQALVERRHGRSEKIKKRAISYLQRKSVDEDFRNLSLDAFKVISDWYHFAILSAMELDNYKGSWLRLGSIKAK